jgi:ribosomal protein L22
VASDEEPRTPGEAGDGAETEKATEAAAANEAKGKEKAAEQAQAAGPDGPGEEPADEGSARPKRARRRRKKEADEPAAAPAKAEAAADDEAPEPEPEADKPEAADDEDAEDAAKKPRRRRGASEVTAGRRQAAAPAPRSADGAVAVRARAKYVRTAPRKARLVIDHIRGKPVDQARAILIGTPRAASRDVLKLLDSAIANAENNHELVADELVVGQAYVDEGPTLKRYRPRALGRATRIRKRTSHMTITLTTNDNRNGR